MPVASLQNPKGALTCRWVAAVAEHEEEWVHDAVGEGEGRAEVGRAVLLHCLAEGGAGGWVFVGGEKAGFVEEAEVGWLGAFWRSGMVLRVW